MQRHATSPQMMWFLSQRSSLNGGKISIFRRHIWSMYRPITIEHCDAHEIALVVVQWGRTIVHSAWPQNSPSDSGQWNSAASFGNRWQSSWTIESPNIVSPRCSRLFLSPFCSHFASFPCIRRHAPFSEVVFLASNTLTHIYQLMTYIPDCRVEEGGRSEAGGLPSFTVAPSLACSSFHTTFAHLLSRRPWIGHRLLVPCFAALFFYPSCVL